MINDIYEINNLCNKQNIKMVVDMVSSVGIYDIDLTKLNNIGLLCFSSNKCIGSYPGLSVVVSNTNILKTLTNEICYLNLQTYYEFSKKNETPFTPCVQNFYSYKTAVKLILKDKLNIKKNMIT